MNLLLFEALHWCRDEVPIIEDMLQMGVGLSEVGSQEEYQASFSVNLFDKPLDMSLSLGWRVSQDDWQKEICSSSNVYFFFTINLIGYLPETREAKKVERKTLICELLDLGEEIRKIEGSGREIEDNNLQDAIERAILDYATTGKDVQIPYFYSHILSKYAQHLAGKLMQVRPFF